MASGTKRRYGSCVVDVVCSFYLVAEATLPPAGRVALAADDDDVLAAPDRQHLRVGVGGLVVAHGPRRVEQPLPRTFQVRVQPARRQRRHCRQTRRELNECNSNCKSTPTEKFTKVTRSTLERP